MDVHLTSTLLGHDEIINFYELFPSKENTYIKYTGQYIIYKQKMDIKTEIYAQNQIPEKEYFTSATSFKCGIGCNEIEGFINLTAGAYF